MDLLVTHARLWDGTGSAVQADVDVWVHDGRIAAIGSGLPVPEGARIVEARGATVLPGLVDAHVHLAFDPGAALRGDPAELHPTLLAHHLRAYLACGVTTVLDPAIPEAEARLVADTLAGGAPGPRFLTLGVPFSPAGGYPAVVIPSFPSVASPAEVEAVMDTNVSLGVVGVKLTVEDGLVRPVWPLYTDQVRAAVLAGAAARDLPVYVHAMTVAEQGLALDLDPHALVHPPDRLDDELVARAAASGVWVMTTLSPLDANRFAFHAQALDEPLVASTVPPIELATAADPELVREYEKRMIRTALPGLSPFAGLLASVVFREGPVEKRLRRTEEALRALHAAGVPLVMGSDSGNWPVIPFEFHGPTSIRELERLGAAGFAPEEVLLMATRNPARMLADDADFGTLEVGHVADLLIVDGDPLTDLGALRSLRLTVRAGDARTPSEWMRGP